MLDLLAPCAPGRRLSGAEVRYLELDPGRSLLVLWRVDVDGVPAEVVVSRGRMHPAEAARTALAAAAAGRAPVGRAVAEAGEPPALVAWYPADPGLPLLASGLEAAAGRIGLASGAEPRLLAWMPQQRATVRFGDAVLKLYRDPAEAEAALRAHAACAGWLPTPAPVGADLPSAVTAQLWAPGRPLGRDDAVAAAERAGRALRRLHDAPIGGLPEHDPADLLALCRAAAARVAVAVPPLAPRLARAAERLERATPSGLVRVPSHGDYTVGQMLEDDGRLWVVDTDTLCAAAAAHDLAAYAGNLVSGRAEDAADARRARDGVVAGYGGAPPGLDWHLAAAVMRRLDRPLRRLKKRWPERTERILAAVEELLPA